VGRCDAERREGYQATRHKHRWSGIAAESRASSATRTNHVQHRTTSAATADLDDVHVSASSAGATRRRRASRTTDPGCRTPASASSAGRTARRTGTTSGTRTVYSGRSTAWVQPGPVGIDPGAGQAGDPRDHDSARADEQRTRCYVRCGATASAPADARLMLVVFDVDGCLIDSEELIAKAYRWAHVVPPDHILEYEGINWLGERGYTTQETAAAKFRKNTYYLHLLSRDDVPTLPPYVVAQRLRNEEHLCHAYTGAPRGTISTLRSRLPRWPFRFALDDVTTPERMAMLRTKYDVTGVYIDDQKRLVDLPPGWRFVHYTGQDANELYREITS
jgi:hypothetical protein